MSVVGTGAASPSHPAQAAAASPAAAGSVTAAPLAERAATDSAPVVARAQPPVPMLFGEPARRLVALGLCFVALAGVLVVAAVYRGQPFSVFDEATHADYSWQIAHGRVPAAGSLIDPEILGEWSCHGSSNNVPIQPCGTPNPTPAKYHGSGQNYNFGHPPVYYLITGVTARGLSAIGVGADFVTSARLVGLLWILAAMGALYFAVRRFGGAWPYAALAAAVLPLCPSVLHAVSSVSNDAAAPLSGAVALLVLARVLVAGNTGWLLPAAASLLVTGTKVMNVLPLLIVAGVLAVAAGLRWRRGDRAAARAIAVVPVAIVLAAGVVYVGWTAFQSGRGQPGWVMPLTGSQDPVQGLPFAELLSSSFKGLQIGSNYFLQPALNGEAIVLWSRLLGGLILAAPFMVLARFEGRTPRWVVGATTLAGMLLLPLVVELQVYLTSGGKAYFPLVSTRYGMSLIPLAVAGAALVAAARSWIKTSVLVIGLGVVAMVPTITGLL
jgi:hypothetical protein